MGDFLFVIRTFVVTIIVLLILQVKIGNFTLEERSMNWVRTSVFVTHLQQVADGSIVFVERSVEKLKNYLTADNIENVRTSQDDPGKRQLINVERSKEYLQEKAQMAKKVVSDTVNAAGDSINEVRGEWNDSDQEMVEDLEDSE